MLGPLEWYMMPTPDAALLISSRVGADLVSQIARPTLKIHNKEEEDELQEESTHP